jgi:Amino acid synthesis
MNTELIRVRKFGVQVHEILHEGGPARAAGAGLVHVSAAAVIANPFVGKFEPELTPFMAALRALGTELTRRALLAIGGAEQVQTYGKGVIVGSSGDLELAALWHEAGGWAMREQLGANGRGQPKAIVPFNEAVGHVGYRLMVPMYYLHASYVRSHFQTTDFGFHDAPRPDELVYGLVMGNGERIHARAGGMKMSEVKLNDGQR